VTLVHAFVTSRVDYCKLNVVLVGAPNLITNKLQRMVNAAARVLTGTRKFDRGLTQLMHDNLHWLDVPESVKYKVIIVTRHCLIGTAPWYLAADCVPVSEMTQRRHLRSAAGHQLVVPSYRLNSCGLRAFSVLGPRLWNSAAWNRLCDELREPLLTANSFRQLFKTRLFAEY